MQTPIYDFVMDRLAKWKYRWPDVAKGSGVPLASIGRIARKETRAPNVHHVQNMADWFRTQPEYPPADLPRANDEAADAAANS